ncbi:hypothetical protein PENSPDRAFT_693941 [Peniophora sp. CONT]|nr:hypothetical protein PENSPDRAFT_693941 [Peniophora sp. CONT]
MSLSQRRKSSLRQIPAQRWYAMVRGGGCLYSQPGGHFIAAPEENDTTGAASPAAEGAVDVELGVQAPTRGATKKPLARRHSSGSAPPPPACDDFLPTRTEAIDTDAGAIQAGDDVSTAQEVIDISEEDAAPRIPMVPSAYPAHNTNATPPRYDQQRLLESFSLKELGDWIPTKYGVQEGEPITDIVTLMDEAVREVAYAVGEHARARRINEREFPALWTNPRTPPVVRQSEHLTGMTRDWIPMGGRAVCPWQGAGPHPYEALAGV